MAMAARPALTVAAEGRIQLFDLHRQKARLGGELHRRIDLVLAHGQFVLGPEVEELYRFYHVPGSNTAVGHIVLRAADTH